MIETTLFHPVLALDALGDEPVAARLLDTDIVLWRDGSARVRAFANRCPHRGAALSLGHLQDGTLACGYHGWRFEGTGRCVEVPALPHWTPPPEHRACAYAAEAAYGLVWVALRPAATGDAAQLPAFVAEHDARLRKFNSGPYDVATSAPRIVENFLDLAHFGYVHEGLLGARDKTALEPYQVQTTPSGFIATECRAWQPQASLAAQGGAMIEYTYEVNAPYTCVLTKIPEHDRDGSVRDAIALFVCPVKQEQSRVWIRMAQADRSSSIESLRAFQDTIFGQDQPVVESQRPRRLPITPEAPVAELHSAADRSSAAYRRYLRERGITFGVC